MFYIVYETINLVNSKRYFGLHRSKVLNDSYLGSGVALVAAIEKYGRDKFKRTNLFVFDNEKEMVLKEQELITQEVVSSDMFYNIAEGGLNNRPAQARTIARKRQADPIYNAAFMEKSRRGSKAATLALRAKFPNGTFEGKRHTTQAKAKISEVTSKAQKGEGNSQFGTKWVCHPDYGAKKVKLNELDFYLTQGWQAGRSYR